MLPRAALNRLPTLARCLTAGRVRVTITERGCLTRPYSPAQHRRVSNIPFRRKDLPTIDTIYALSTAPGRAAIAIVRISGPACLDIYGGLCPNRPFPSPRVATLRKLYHPTKPATLLDSGLVLYFPGPDTVTGEDVLELHIHGGPAIVRSVLTALPTCTETPQGRTRRRTAEYSVIRPAEAGEFTKRAFYNDRLSLPEAEALGDALAAETEQQRRLAVLGSESGLSERYESWRQLLLLARGELEALIDFSEDQHFDESPVEFIASVTRQIQALEVQLKMHITNASRGELLRQGIRVALLGAPNAGKSSLLNRIVGREAAIVSAEEGTTRDIVDVSVDLSGWLVRLGDMAGLRTSPNAAVTDTVSPIGEIEKEGIRRARARALQSDVVIVLLALEPDPIEGSVSLKMNDEVHAAAAECMQAGKTLVVAVNKSDLIPGLADSPSTKAAMQRYIYNALPGLPRENIHFISCRDRVGAASLAPSDPSPPPTTPPTNAPPQSHQDSIQPFLQSLTDLFTILTTAQQTPLNSDSSSSSSRTNPLTLDEAQAYWTASLSITHRQTTYLQACLANLQAFLDATTAPHSHLSLSAPVSGPEAEMEIDIVTSAEHLRAAAHSLSKITGRGDGGDVEDVLGVVFEK